MKKRIIAALLLACAPTAAALANVVCSSINKPLPPPLCRPYSNTPPPAYCLCDEHDNCHWVFDCTQR